MAKNATITIEIPVTMPRLSSSGKVVLFGGLNGKIKTQFGEMSISANVYSSVSDPETTTLIEKVKSVPGIDAKPDNKASKAAKELAAKEARQTVLKSLSLLPNAA